MSSAAKVGVFMLVILAIIGYFVLKIEDIDLHRGKGQREVKAVFDNVAGLNNKSDVRIAGVRKGKVTDIEVRPQDGRAVVTMQIDDDVPIHRDAVAHIANLGLLGEKYIEIDPGTPKTAVVPPQQPVMLGGNQPASIDEVTSQVSDIAKDVKAITESLRNVMAGPQGQQRLEDIVENIHAVTAQMRDLIAANRENVDATVGNMRAITADLRVELPKLAASIDRVASQIGGTVGENREDVRRIVENMRVLSADLKATSENMGSITGQVRSGQGTVGKLIYDEEAYNRLNAALGSVESGVNELKTMVGRANKIGLDIGLKGDYIAGMDKNSESDPYFHPLSTTRSTVSLRLVPNIERNRFYNIELADDPRGRKREKDTVNVYTNPATGESFTLINHETRYDRDYRLSAQAGWLLDNMAVRVGLFDNTGGAGVDYVLNRRLKVVGEAYDFGERYDRNPHLKTWGEYTLRLEKPKTPRLFVTAGVDNVLNDTAFTLGGGIRWSDEDLKYLLGSIPIGK